MKLGILKKESKDSKTRNLKDIEQKIIARFNEISKKREEFDLLKTNFKYVEMKNILKDSEKDLEFYDQYEFMGNLNDTEMIYDEYKEIFNYPSVTFKGDEDQRLIFQILSLKSRCQQEQINGLKEENARFRKMLEGMNIGHHEEKPYINQEPCL
jgi:hypothetical protein